jgi:hypothetical protein
MSRAHLEILAKVTRRFNCKSPPGTPRRAGAPVVFSIMERYGFAHRGRIVSSEESNRRRKAEEKFLED